MPSDEVPETTEVAPTSVQGAEVPEVEGAQVPGVEEDVPEGAGEDRAPERAENVGAPKKRKMPANRVPEGGAPGERRKKKKKDPVPDLAGRDKEEHILRSP